MKWIVDNQNPTMASSLTNNDTIYSLWVGEGNSEAFATDRDARTSGMEGMIDIPNEMDYYGEHSFQMQYKDTIGEPFDWLYIDADTLKQKAGKCGYAVGVVTEGEHYDYLAKITKET